MAPAFGQKAGGWSPASPSVFLELGGNGGIASFNYDRRFSARNNGFGGRIGIGIADGRDGHIFPELVPTIPIGINYLTGTGAHHLEMGAGLTIGTSEFARYQNSVYFVPSIGYRLQAPAKAFTFRAFVSPMMVELFNVQFSAGLSFGARF